MTPRHKESDLKSVEHLLGYYDQRVLAAYRTQPDRFRIESDYFEGELHTTDEYYRELERSGKTSESMRVRFGYRTLHGGSLAVVVWLPDLRHQSEAHIQQWSGFRLSDPEWTTDHDERFDKWVRRYIKGDWDVDSGPLYHLGQTISVINSLTVEVIGVSLYKHELDKTLGYPAADNTHQYQDSHRRLYGYLIDGLDKKCIDAIASRLARDIKVGDKKTLEALTTLFPDLKMSPSFTAPLALVSEQRRLASHGVRSPATKFPAFSKFTEDLFLCVTAVKELLHILERELGANGEKMHDRHTAKNWLPEIDRAANASYPIARASQMKGKTVARVEFGPRKTIRGVHGSDALLIHFTDGSIMGLDTGSNAGNLARDEKGPRPEDFRVDFIVSWVPELPRAPKKVRQKQQEKVARWKPDEPAGGASFEKSGARGDSQNAILWPTIKTKEPMYNQHMAKDVIHISEAEAASDFAALMARVRAGAKVIIENGAQPVAVLHAAEPVRRTISECIALAKVHEEETGKAPVLDPDFAEDMEEILSHREPWNPPAWE